MGTPADVFKSLPEKQLFELAEEVLSQENNVLSTERASQDKAVELLVAETGVRDMRTAERQVISCTRNEVFARWIASKRSALGAAGSTARSMDQKPILSPD